MKFKFFLTMSLLFVINCVYGQEMKCQSCSLIQIDGDNQKKIVNIIKASITCTDTCSIIIMFTEDCMDEFTVKNALRRKMIRRYNDFSLSMLAWEANMRIMNHICTIPSSFVKLLEPGESFDLFFYSEQHDDSTMINMLSNHILKIHNQEMKDSGFDNFIEGAKTHNYLYSHSFILLEFDLFYAYMNENESKMIIQIE